MTKFDKTHAEETTFPKAARALTPAAACDELVSDIWFQFIVSVFISGRSNEMCCGSREEKGPFCFSGLRLTFGCLFFACDGAVTL